MNGDAYIFGATRTPFGRHAGALATIRPDDLLAAAIRRLIEIYQVPPRAVEDIIAGCANQAGEDSRNVARHAALLAGLPVDIAGITLNRLCGSGLAAVADAARVVACGQADVLVAGGTESMTRAPYVVGKAERPYSRDVRTFDSTLGPRFPNPRFVAEFGNDTNPQVGDNCAHEYGITREESDRFALASQRNYARALADGFYEGEITTPVLAHHGKTESVVVTDEPPRPESTLEGLAKLKTVNEGGVVTAGNASSVNDGAAALLIGSRQAGERHGWKPWVRIVGAAVAGVPPRLFGIGPIPASRKVLERAGLTLDQMDVIEINEAFAPQVLACLKGLGIPLDDARVNPNGGAIAVGHPLGASGARLAMTAARELIRRNGRYALLTLCIGVGQGIAVIIERAR
jgi:acetyl-CoA C-acetyltransferase